MLKKLITQLAVSSILSGLIYFTFAAVLYARHSPGKVMDTRTFDKSYYMSEANYLVTGRGLLMKPGKRVFLVGSSQVIQGFRPDELGKYIQDYEIHNVGVDAINISQVKLILELIYQAVPTESYKDTVFVLGISYQMFRECNCLYDTIMSSELRRYGFYRVEEGTVVPQVPGWIIRYSDFILPPLIWVDNITKTSKENLGNYMKNARALASSKQSRSDVLLSFLKPSTYAEIFLKKKTKADLNKITITEKAKMDQVNWDRDIYFNNGKSNLSEKEFEVLDDVMKIIDRNGSLLFIIDMPLPRFYQETSDYYHKYLLEHDRLVEGTRKYTSVHYIDMRDMNDDNDFYDIAHPRPMVTDKWSKRIADEINAVVDSHEKRTAGQ